MNPRKALAAAGVSWLTPFGAVSSRRKAFPEGGMMPIASVFHVMRTMLIPPIQPLMLAQRKGVVACRDSFLKTTGKNLEYAMKSANDAV